MSNYVNYTQLHPKKIMRVLGAGIYVKLYVGEETYMPDFEVQPEDNTSAVDNHKRKLNSLFTLRVLSVPSVVCRSERDKKLI